MPYLYEEKSGFTEYSSPADRGSHKGMMNKEMADLVGHDVVRSRPGMTK